MCISIYLSLYDKSLTLPFCRFLIFFSVASTFVALLFLMLNLEAFEILAHNVDYMNDVAKALVDSLLIATVVRRPSYHTGRRKKVRSKNRGKNKGTKSELTLHSARLSHGAVFPVHATHQRLPNLAL